MLHSTHSTISDRMLVGTVASSIRVPHIADDGRNSSNGFLPSSPAKDAKAGLAPRVILVLYEHFESLI